MGLLGMFIFFLISVWAAVVTGYVCFQLGKGYVLGLLGVTIEEFEKRRHSFAMNAGLEYAKKATEAKTRACPKCGAVAGEWCKDNPAKVCRERMS